jgi:hypothetical protein
VLAALLLIGINDDDFFDNQGALNLRITGDAIGQSAVPVPGALPLFAGGLGLIGLAARRRRNRAVA